MLNKLSNNCELNALLINSESEIEIETILNTPDVSEDIVSVCDHLLVSLENAKKDADEILLILQDIKK